MTGYGRTTACLTGQGTMKTRRRNHDSKGEIHLPWDKRHQLYYGRVEEQETPRTHLSCQGQFAAARSGRYWNMGLHAADAGQVQEDQKFRHPHRGQPRTGTYERLYHHRLGKAVGRVHGRVRQHRAIRQERQNVFPENQPHGQQGYGAAPSGIQERHSPPSWRVLPHRRAGAHQQRPRHTPACAACRRACSPETGLDHRRRGAGHEHRAGEPGLHGNLASHGKLVMARIRRPATGQGLRALGTTGRQERVARLCIEERKRPVQGFRTRQGAQPHGEQARKHVEETARGSQDKDRSGAARCRHTITDCNPNYSG